MRTLSDYETQILRKLDILTALLLDLVPPEPSPIKVKITKLTELGLSPAEVGRIIGRPANYVSAVLGSKKAKAKR